MRRWLPALCAAALLSPVLPARALVPYVYVPTSEELSDAGVNIAGAAAGLLRIGQIAEARSLGRLAVQLLPDDPRAWLVLAEAELRSSDENNRSEQAAKAEAALARAKELDPKNAGVWFAEGALNLRNDRPAAAEKLLQQGLRLDPKNPGAYFDLGNAQIKQGNLGAALKSFEKASGLRQNFWEAVNNQGIVLFEEDRRDAAIDRWRQAVEMSDGEAEPMLALAAALYANGDDSADTLALAVQALIKQPDYVLAAFQEDQLWGQKLVAATQELFENEQVKGAVRRAKGLATFQSN